MKILITARELMDRHQWERACELTGLSSWVVNEGQMDMDDEVTLTAEAADKLGLLAPGVYSPEPDEDAKDAAKAAAMAEWERAWAATEGDR